MALAFGSVAAHTRHKAVAINAHVVVPAKAGIHSSITLDTRLRGYDEFTEEIITAFIFTAAVIHSAARNPALTCCQRAGGENGFPVEFAEERNSAAD